jgi:hypothetical protein
MISSNRVVGLSNDYTKVFDNKYDTLWVPAGIRTWIVVEPSESIQIISGFRMKIKCYSDTQLKLFTNVTKNFSIIDSNGNRILSVVPSNPVYNDVYTTGVITIDHTFTNPISNVSNIYIEFNKITDIYEIEFFGI